MGLNAHQKFIPAALNAIFDAFTGTEEMELECMTEYLRHFADFLEQNGERALPASFGSYEAFQGAYRQWNITRESNLSKEVA